MFQTFFHYIKNLLPWHEQQSLATKRRLEEEDDQEPRKFRKLFDNSMDDKSIYTIYHKSISYKGHVESKENIVVDDVEDDEVDECFIVADYAKNQWKTPSPRKSIRHPGEFYNASQLTCNSQQSTSAALPSAHMIPEVQELRNIPARMLPEIQELQNIPGRMLSVPEIQVLKHITPRAHSKGGCRGQEVKPRSISNKIFHGYRTGSLGGSSGMPKRAGCNKIQKFSNSLQNRMKCLQEVYRLDEKFKYMELLKSQTNLTSLLAPFKAHVVLGSNAKKSTTIPVIDLTKEKLSVRVQRDREVVPITAASRPSCSQHDDEVAVVKVMSPPKRVNSLQDCLRANPVTSDSLVMDILEKHSTESERMRRQAAIEEAKVEVLRNSSQTIFNEFLELRLKEYMKITEPAIAEEEPVEYVLPQLSDVETAKVAAALKPNPAGQVLVSKFGLEITRRDIYTLNGLNWLNDEVINFYMNLIMERCKGRDLPKVYAFNTFFYPKLTSGGHQSLKRWTKKVDIFAHDLILVPIHLGVHWCMSVIDFKSKEVRFYDSMGTPNDRCLRALLAYLEAESLDKKKVRYNTEAWEEVNVDGIPQQMNGSDCGVFSCMFAEHIARDCPLLFSQEHMPYFRKKMVLEILQGKLIS